MSRSRAFQVKDVARLTGVSVRTLHYYDEIGLVVPGDRTPAGYRLYLENDLLRLQQVLIGRSLGLALADIKRSLDDPDFDHVASLKRQRSLLSKRAAETKRMIASIDAALDHAARPKEKIMDLKAIFDGFDPSEHENEAKEKWGDTDAYRESAQRTKDYSEEDWRAIKQEQTGIWEDAAMAMQAGEAPDGEVARDIVRRHRWHVSRWFYALTPEAHVHLADMWEADSRFADTIDKHGKGLTGWLAAAVRAACDDT